MAMAFDPGTGVVSGEPIPVTERIGFDTSLSRAALSISETGMLVHRTGIAETRQLVWLDRAGNTRGTVGDPNDDAIAAPELTGDGRRIAVFRTVDGKTDVWTIDAARGVPSRFTYDASFNGYPVWAASGDSIFFSSQRDGAYNLFRRPASGTGAEQTLIPQPGLRIANDVSPDGRFLLFAVQVPQTRVDLWALPLTAGAIPIPIAQTPYDEMGGQFSPDGQWVAYQSNKSGRMEVYVTRFPSGGASQQVSSAGGAQPRWRLDGGEVFYLAADGRMIGVPIRCNVNEQTCDPGAPTPLFPTRLASGANVLPAVGTRPQYDVAADGRFLMNVAIAPPPPLTVAFNWQTEQKR